MKTGDAVSLIYDDRLAEPVVLHGTVIRGPDPHTPYWLVSVPGQPRDFGCWLDREGIDWCRGDVSADDAAALLAAHILYWSGRVPHPGFTLSGRWS